MIGNFVNPITPALLVKVSEVNTIIPTKVVQTTGMEGLLCTMVSSLYGENEGSKPASTSILKTILPETKQHTATASLDLPCSDTLYRHTIMDREYNTKTEMSRYQISN